MWTFDKPIITPEISKIRQVLTGEQLAHLMGLMEYYATYLQPRTC